MKRYLSFLGEIQQTLGRVSSYSTVVRLCCIARFRALGNPVHAVPSRTVRCP